MDGARIGADLRLLRIRRRWRQRDLAERAGCSQAEISRIERGLLDPVPVGRLDSIAKALGSVLFTTVLWQGERLDRLRDARHAALVELLVGRLTTHGWIAAPETSFAIYGERGSIDILAFHPAARVLLVIEVKTGFGDVQSTIAIIDRKERLAVQIARSRGWLARRVSVLLAVAESSTNRRVVARHAATFGTAFPVRGRSVSARVSKPCREPFRGLLFLSSSHGMTGRRVERVQRPRERCPNGQRTHESVRPHDRQPAGPRSTVTG